MSLLVIGTVAFDAIETPFGKTDKIVGGAATYASLAASYFYNKVKIVAVVGDDFPQSEIADLEAHQIGDLALREVITHNGHDLYLVVKVRSR